MYKRQEWGYKYIEQSPHPQINPFYKHPRASREIMAEYKHCLLYTSTRLCAGWRYAYPAYGILP